MSITKTQFGEVVHTTFETKDDGLVIEHITVGFPLANTDPFTSLRLQTVQELNRMLGHKGRDLETGEYKKLRDAPSYYE